MIKIALIGNPNCGKTLLFNSLTGANQYVGNWAGVTVEVKESYLKNNKDVILADLPGIYSLSPYSPEEVVSRDYLLNDSPDIILNVIDGTNLERNLYLTTQLCEIGIPIVLAVNMMDLVKKRGDIIHTEELKKCFGCAGVFEISALKGTGIKKCINESILIARDSKNSAKMPILHSFTHDMESALLEIEHIISSKVDAKQRRYFAIKVFERDSLISETMPDCSAVIKKMEKKYNDDSESIIVEKRYEYISSCIKECREKSGKILVSERIDQIVTNRFLALPIFALIMFVVYYLSVSSIGGLLSKIINELVFAPGGLPYLVGTFLDSINCATWLIELIVDGILGGVGAVLGFAPQIFMLFIFLSILEDCGYMSRIAFILDRIFHRFGLSGKSFIPILVGTGCGVPGIMASRTIENENDRRMTIITTTFIPCGAKLPVIALIASALFGGAWWVAPSAYFIGIAAIISSGAILKKTKPFSGEETPFIMELPSYHMPLPISIARTTWDRTWSYIKKAGTIILIASCLVWFLSNYGFLGGKLVEAHMDDSILAWMGRGLTAVFAPLGFGSWQAAIATVLGIVAKEEIVGVFGVLYSDISAVFTPLSGYSFLIFNLLCVPCVAAVAAIIREMNSVKWTLFAIAYQCSFAYCVSLCVYQFGTLLMTGAMGVETIAAFSVFALFLFMLFRKPPSKKLSH